MWTKPLASAVLLSLKHQLTHLLVWFFPELGPKGRLSIANILKIVAASTTVRSSHVRETEAAISSEDRFVSDEKTWMTVVPLKTDIVLHLKCYNVLEHFETGNHLMMDAGRDAAPLVEVVVGRGLGGALIKVVYLNLRRTFEFHLINHLKLLRSNPSSPFDKKATYEYSNVCSWHQHWPKKDVTCRLLFSCVLMF